MRRGSGKPPTRSEEALVGTRVCTTGSSSVTFESWRKFSLNGDGTPMTRTGWIRVILTACEPLVRTKHMLELFCQSWARHREINFPDTLLYRIASSHSVRPNNRTTPGTGLALQRRRLLIVYRKKNSSALSQPLALVEAFGARGVGCRTVRRGG